MHDQYAAKNQGRRSVELVLKLKWKDRDRQDRLYANKLTLLANAVTGTLVADGSTVFPVVKVENLRRGRANKLVIKLENKSYIDRLIT